MALLNTTKRYSPGELGGYVGGSGNAWGGKEFFAGGEKYQIIDNGDGTRGLRQLNPTKSDIESGRAVGSLTPFLVDDISKQIIELEDKLANIPGVSLSQAEMDAFLEKAIAEVEPYYNKKKAEIEQGIKEGKIRNAEDTLMLLRQVNTDVTNTLSKYDIDQAQSEEEFINTMSEITSARDENLETKRFEWKSRLDNAKQDLVSKDIYDSGIGRKEVNDLQTRQQQELSSINRIADESVTKEQTAQKFNLERISLARKAVADDRKRRIGDETQSAELENKARADIGLGTNDPLASDAELLYNRDARGITPRSPEDITNLEEERRKAVESRKLSLQQEELDIRKSQEEAQRKAIQSEIASRQRQMNSLRY